MAGARVARGVPALGSADRERQVDDGEGKLRTADRVQLRVGDQHVTAECVRAIEERFYGRTARMFYVAVERRPGGDHLPRDFNDFGVAARESVAAHEEGKLWGFIPHARITEAQASAFWERMAELVTEFDQLPRSGKTMYGSAVGVYPTYQPTLPDGGD